MARKAFIITPKDRKEEELLRQLIARMGLEGRLLDEEELEDAGLALALTKVDRTKLADSKRVMRKLRS
ncbi:MAG: hypothetical protein H6595_05245 [Flavobacteriales bacterium]|nr:hypothetical protein [Flavobacteriales bacterium]MCB9166869.1 hypothetical protein [Flavobacteriales bacterium]MCB9170569.1 hypothetical protein [Flavobacteriales bacterium]MCB9193218.1 hypothetical protein [Flavobacteriales bacterium]